MIPKIIHYCWFGRKDIPDRLQKCIKSWEKHLTDYKFICWNEDDFDINSTIWTKEAYQAKKYAFVSDYVRLLALEKYGGIYLDTDVFLKQPLDSFLHYKAFTGFEKENAITSAVIGCEPHFPLIQEFLSFYDGKHFLGEDGSLNNEANVVMMTNILLKYGLQLDDTEQSIEEMRIFPCAYFCPLDFYHNDHSTEQTVAIHYFDASWLDEDTKKMIEKERTPWHKAIVKVMGKFKSFVMNSQR